MSCFDFMPIIKVNNENKERYFSDLKEEEFGFISCLTYP